MLELLQMDEQLTRYKTKKSNKNINAILAKTFIKRMCFNENVTSQSKVYTNCIEMQKVR